MANSSWGGWDISHAVGGVTHAPPPRYVNDPHAPPPRYVEIGWILPCNYSGDGCVHRGPFPNTSLVLVFFLVISSVGTVANTLLLVAIAGFKLLKKPANYYVSSVIVADLFMCAGYAPYCVVTTLDPEFRDGCEVMALAQGVALTASYISLASVAINRYLLVAVTNVRYTEVYSCCGVALSLLLVWLAAAICILPVMLGEGEVGVDRRLGICTFSFSNEFSHLYEILVAVLVAAPCLVIIIGAYVGVWIRFRRSMRTVHDRSRSTAPTDGWRLSANLFIITMVTFFCWAPIILITLIDFNNQSPDLLYQLVVLLSMTQSCLNPILHLVLNRNVVKVYQMARRRMSKNVRSIHVSPSVHPS